MKLLTNIKDKITNILDLNNDSCYKHYGTDGKCNGILGGDSSTEYLSYGCIDCKYLMLDSKSNDKANNLKRGDYT